MAEWGFPYSAMLFWQAERSAATKTNINREDASVNPCKKVIELTGSLICPIRVGEPAFICEATGMRRTSTVLQMESVSAYEICFETVNTNYRLHLVNQEVPA